MQAKPAHITLNGHPLCACGLVGTNLMAKHNVTCGHGSIAEANRAKAILQRHVAGVRVVAGSCPVNDEWNNRQDDWRDE